MLSIGLLLSILVQGTKLLRRIQSLDGGGIYSLLLIRLPDTTAAIGPLMSLADLATFARRLDEACERVILDHYLLGDGSPNGLRTKRTDFVQRLRQAGFGEGAAIKKFWEVRDFLSRKLGAERVLLSCAGFNAVGQAHDRQTTSTTLHQE